MNLRTGLGNRRRTDIKVNKYYRITGDCKVLSCNTPTKAPINKRLDRNICKILKIGYKTIIVIDKYQHESMLFDISKLKFKECEHYEKEQQTEYNNL